MSNSIKCTVCGKTFSSLGFARHRASHKDSTKKLDKKDLQENDLQYLSEQFHKWSGFTLSATNLETALSEIRQKEIQLRNEIGDYASYLESLAKQVFPEN